MPDGFFLALVMIILFFILGIVLSSIINLVIPLFKTPKKDMRKLLDIMDLKDDDVFVDLGSGDASVIFEARKRNKNAELYGYEISPVFLLISDLKKNMFFPLDKKFHVEAENLFDVNYSIATKIYCYLSPEALEVLRKKFKRAGEKKNLKVYSYKYQIPDTKFKKKFELESGQVLYEYDF